MAKDTFNIVHCDDWAGLYANGWLVCEGHKISYHDLLLYGVVATVQGVDDDWVEAEGGFPKLLNSIPQEKRRG